MKTGGSSPGRLRRILWGAALAAALAPFTARAATEAYFTDESRSVEARLVKEMGVLKKSLEGAIFDITNPSLGEAMAKAGARGVRVRLVTDRRQASGKYSQVRLLRSRGIEFKLMSGRGGRGVMHHKFALFDGRLLATGSYNWSRGAEKSNYENMIFTGDSAMIQSYQRAFDRLWRDN
jgi:phosphatidylserine/phosphatidylglycerophosphate/cardiolipin synthase-like enzyme